MCYLMKWIGIIAISCLLLGCVASEKNVTERPCQLCGYQGFQGDNRLGVLLVSSGRIMEIEVPAYEMPEDLEGKEKSGFSMHAGKAAQGNNRVTIITRPDERTAHVLVEIKKKAKQNEKTLEALYCRVCMPKVKKAHTDMLLVDLREHAVYPVDQNETFEIRGYEVISQNHDDVTVLEISFREF